MSRAGIIDARARYRAAARPLRNTGLHHLISETDNLVYVLNKGKGLPQQVEVAQGVPCRLRSRIFLTFSTTRVVGREPYAPAAFTPGEIPGTHFQRLSRPQDTWFCRGEPQKKIPSDTTGNRSQERPTNSAGP